VIGREENGRIQGWGVLCCDLSPRKVVGASRDFRGSVVGMLSGMVPHAVVSFPS